jgi:cobalt-zinc-cadmium efflux system membrane fusion protein
MSFIKSLSVPTLLIAVVAVAAVGCDKTDTNTSPTGSNAAPTPPVAEQPKPATQPLIPVAPVKDWCPEHGVPESICVQCNASLAAGFKAKGDWDEKHSLPKSQCFQCDPSLKQKFAAAYKDKYGQEPPAGGDAAKKSETP